MSNPLTHRIAVQATTKQPYACDCSICTSYFGMPVPSFSKLHWPVEVECTNGRITDGAAHIEGNRVVIVLKSKV